MPDGGVQVGRDGSDDGVLVTPRGWVAAPLASRMRPATAKTRRSGTPTRATIARLEGRARRVGSQIPSSGRGRLSNSRWKTRSMLISGSIPHLRAHARFRLGQCRAHGAGLYAKMPRDLAVVEAEVELGDHHRPLALGQAREEPPDLHAIERGCDLVLRHTRSGVVEAQQRSPEAAPAGTHRDDEEPAGEVIVLGGRPTQARRRTRREWRRGRSGSRSTASSARYTRANSSR